MKMQRPEFEIIAFAAGDIIVTSGGGGGFIPTQIEVIWLSQESVYNYNNYSTTDLNLDTEAADWDEGYYTAYNGKVTPPKNPKYYKSSDYSLDKPTEGLYVVGVNDKAGYEAVFNWLISKSGSE